MLSPAEQIARCQREMAQAWKGIGDDKAYLYALWYFDWLREKELLTKENL